MFAAGEAVASNLRSSAEVTSHVTHNVLLSRTVGLSDKFGDYIYQQFGLEELERQNKMMTLTGSTKLNIYEASSSPFISGNGFRDMCLPYVIDKAQHCNFNATLLASVPDGDNMVFL
jgi:hypothetical protein